MTDLRTDRLSLRRPKMSDTLDLIHAVNHWDVARWFAEIPHPYSEQDAVRFISSLDRAAGHVWFVFEGETLVGCMGLQKQFGYWLTPAAWGRGIATEAGDAVLNWHFQNHDNDVVAQYLVGNTGSARVLSKLGFREIGASICSSRAAGENLPAVSLRLTRAEWETNR